MRKLFLIPLLVAVGLPVYAQTTWPILDNSTADATAWRTSTVANVRSSRVATVVYRHKLMAAGTADVEIHLDGSLDGATWVLDAMPGVTNAGTGTTEVSGAVSADTYGYVLLRARVYNANSVALTNVYATAGTKRNIDTTVPLPVALGGTASSTAADARTALGVPAATSGTLTTPTLAGNVTASGLTASLPIFTDGSKVLVSKSIANTKLALGIQAGTGTTAAGGTATVTFPTAFASAPVVICKGAGPTNSVSSVTSTGFAIDTKEGTAAFSWIAVGAP